MKARTAMIEQLIGSPAKIRILTALRAWKGSELTERQLAATCGLSTFGLRHALKDLEQSRLVSKKTVGRSNVWLLNERSFPFKVVKPILEIILNMPSPLKVLSESIKAGLPIAEIERVILFGSAAEGDFSAAGDLDVAILLKKMVDAESAKEMIQRKADELSGEFLGVVGKRIEPLVFSKEEWESLRDKPLGRSIAGGKELYPHASL